MCLETGVCACNDVCHNPSDLCSAECDGSGTCTEGVCACDYSCLDSQVQCTTFLDCGPAGYCSSGNCTCVAKYGPSVDGRYCDTCTSLGFDACHQGVNCALSTICNHGGSCFVNDAGSAQCNCPERFSNVTGSTCQTCDKCHAVPSTGCITAVNTCFNDGTCNPVTGECMACGGGYSGMRCEIAPPAGVSGGAVAGGVLGGLAAASALGAVFYKRRHPGKKWRDLLPTLPSMKSPGAYSSITPLPESPPVGKRGGYGGL